MKTLCLFIFCIFAIGCKSGTKSPETSEESKGLRYKHDWKSPEGAVTFMTFNVENLFDTQDDPEKNDETFLPKARKQTATHKKKCEPIGNPRWKRQCLEWDWNEGLLKYKIDVLVKTIQQAKSGKGPDILVLQEVENKAVLDRLNSSGLGYPTVVLIEGKDKRGIDVAVLSRLKLVGKPTLHQIPFSGVPQKRVEDTRGILQVDLALPNKETLSVLGVHFPAPFHPAKMRIQAYKQLNSILESLPRERLVVAAGDFNVPRREDEELDLVHQSTKGHWVVGHKVACKACPGTTYYPPKKSWSFLDMILWSARPSESKWTVLEDSMRILNQGPGQIAKSGAPAMFESEGPSGVSDHWPLAVDLVRK